MAHVSAPQIEHYHPKSKFPKLAFVWHNWLLSCGRCNDTKWAHFPNCDGQPCLLDPASEDPAQHLKFVGYMPMPLTQRGAETIKLVGLERSPLEEERSRWLMSINVLMLLSCTAESRAEARELLIWSMQDDAPYAAMTRCYLSERMPRLTQSTQTPVNLPDPIEHIQRLVTVSNRYLKLIE